MGEGPRPSSSYSHHSFAAGTVHQPSALLAARLRHSLNALEPGAEPVVNEIWAHVNVTDNDAYFFIVCE